MKVIAFFKLHRTYWVDIFFSLFFVTGTKVIITVHRVLKVQICSHSIPQESFAQGSLICSRSLNFVSKWSQLFYGHWLKGQGHMSFKGQKGSNAQHQKAFVLESLIFVWWLNWLSREFVFCLCHLVKGQVRLTYEGQGGFHSLFKLPFGSQCSYITKWFDTWLCRKLHKSLSEIAEFVLLIRKLKGKELLW